MINILRPVHTSPAEKKKKFEKTKLKTRSIFICTEIVVSIFCFSESKKGLVVL